MANNFFAQFPKISYNIDGQGTFITLTDIVKNVDVNDIYANNNTYYTYYDIGDGERPDVVSSNLYGSPNYYWTLFILNNNLRAGLSDAWPLSLNQLEKMLADEYDDYSAITFMPSLGTNNGVADSGLFQLTNLWTAYLPYLRLINADGSLQAKILKYDKALLQLIVYDITKTDNSGVPNSRDTFVNDDQFKLIWSNPYDEIDDAALWLENESLKTEFVDRIITTYFEIDGSALIDVDILPEEYTQEEIDNTIKIYNRDYVFNKFYQPAPVNYRWSSYRNAASEYYTVVDDVAISTAAFDVLLDEDIVEPDYIPFHRREELINESKSKIKVIRKDRINDFVNTYFRVLLND